ncbi:MAG: aminotransferase class IV family protein [Planctomycetes bacterium]|nr:aminotransferase class IV family protein [Planctomycetota bacterium]
MSSYPVWVDGAFAEPFAPVIAAEDPGFALGVAVFETILYESGTAYFVAEHFARLERGARELGIAWPPRHDPRAALAEYLARLGPRDAAVRVTLTRGVADRGPTLVVVARDLVRVADPGAKVIVSRFTKRHDDPFERVKSTNRLRNVLAREEAVRLGAWDALLPTEEGDLAEGTWCNLFALSGGRLLTPALERGCLAGILRDQVLRELALRPLVFPMVEARIQPDDLRVADEVFATNTTGRIVPIVEVIGVRTGLPGSAGPVVRELRARIARIEARHRAEHRP